MSGVSNPEVIDVVTQDPATGEVAVIMVEDRAWSAGDHQIDELLQKINSYIYFIESGALVEQFPDAAGNPVRIQLDCPERPRGQAGEVIEQAQKMLLERGVKFVVNTILSVPRT